MATGYSEASRTSQAGDDRHSSTSDDGRELRREHRGSDERGRLVLEEMDSVIPAALSTNDTRQAADAGEGYSGHDGAAGDAFSEGESLRIHRPQPSLITRMPATRMRATRSRANAISFNDNGGGGDNDARDMGSISPREEDFYPMPELFFWSLMNISVEGDVEDYLTVVCDSPHGLECPICTEKDLMPYTPFIRIEACDHIFHETCLRKWVNESAGSMSTCPYCRAHIFKPGHA
ncbi:hypothetical protein EJ04DRAFT_520823 [Polyplosphaeria fusca]|uniref:RING-type domain-containing protein n=1 Tax=Polyplosphaeria fusca TaxID=682080 RepID=A0A9P4R6K9_9PLEO|nr:hypothetical protein EJ04DRAFT_520823 [Polyplosphaeria fusca]